MGRIRVEYKSLNGCSLHLCKDILNPRGNGANVGEYVLGALGLRKRRSLSRKEYFRAVKLLQREALKSPRGS